MVYYIVIFVVLVDKERKHTDETNESFDSTEMGECFKYLLLVLTQRSLLYKVQCIDCGISVLYSINGYKIYM